MASRSQPSGAPESAAPEIIFVDGSPGFGPCAGCGQPEELRMGYCFDCAMAGEERAARRSVLQHLRCGFGRILLGNFSFATRMDFVWAWERLTKTGDYAPGGEFDSQYFNPRQPVDVLIQDAAERQPSPREES